MSENKFIPNSFQIPNFFVDSILPNMGEFEVKVYLVIVRKTLGWQKNWDAISLSQFKNLLGTKDERTIKTAILKLIQKDLVIKVEKPGYPSRFAINLNPNPLHVDEGSHADVPPICRCNNPLHVDEGGVPPCGCTPQKPIKTTNTKNNSLRERESLQTFKSELIAFCPNFIFALPQKLGYASDHKGFELQNGYIFCRHNQQFLQKNESFTIWQYLYTIKNDVFKLAQNQLNPPVSTCFA